MGRETGISWTEATFNPWWGCTKVGPGCDLCYAEAQATRYGSDLWGDGKPRRFFSDRHWNEPVRWNKEAMKRGYPMLVFCASMADVFDNEVAQEHRERLWRLIRETPWLVWQIVTKRVPNIVKMLPYDWGNGYRNVWLIGTMVNQQEVDRDWPRLREIPAVMRGISHEPGLECIRVPPDCGWLITGGESDAQRNHHARLYESAWAVDMAAQCRVHGIPFFLKQMGNNCDLTLAGKGADPSAWPAELRIQEFPAVTPPQFALL